MVRQLGLARTCIRIALAYALCLIALVVGAQVAAAPLTELQLEAAQLTLTDFDYIADPTGELTLDALQSDSQAFTSAAQSGAALVPGTDVYWLKYQLRNSSAEPGRWHIGHEWWIHIDFYLFDSDGEMSEHITTGQLHPYPDRPVAHYSTAATAVPVELAAGETTLVFARLQASSTELYAYPTTLAANVLSEAESSKQRSVMLRVVYLCAGVLLGTLIYNLFVYLSTRDHSYVYYLGIVACSLIFTFTNFIELPAFIAQHDDAPRWISTISPSGSSLYGFFIIMFTRTFLNVRENFPVLDKILLGIIVGLLALPVLVFFGQVLLAGNISALSGLITMVMVMITAIASVWKRQPSAVYFLIAFAFFAVGIFIFLGSQLGLFPKNNLTNYAMQYGTSLEAVLFSFALGNRINLLRRENESSQQQLIAQMTENEKLQKEWTSRLEEKVEEQTRSLSSTNQELSEQNSSLFAVNNLSRELSAQLTRPKIVELVGQRIQALYPGSQVRLFLASDRQAPMQTSYASNENDSAASLDALVARVRDTGTVVKHQQALADGSSASTLAVPIRRGDDVSGALVLQGESRYSEASENLIGALGANIGTALSNASLFEETTALNRELQAENVRISAELSVAAKIQQMILPTSDEVSRISQLQLAAFMVPADEVGGDYYDILQVGDRVTVAIGDVTGHGLASGVLMMQTQIALRALLENSAVDDVSVLGKLNQSLYRNLQRMQEDRNLSLSVVSHQGDQVSISGQHEDILLIDQNGSSTIIDTIDLGLPVGLEANIDAYLDTVNLSLKAGDGIVLYTDGITEAENAEGVQYGMDRLRQVVEQQWRNDVQHIVDSVIADVRSHIGSGPVVDDVTLVIMKQPGTTH
ncbi:hypothetical protein AB833_01505 [Chromatiales bacterium (ex Bugula neritina AB1)]|nr:hypothetical protein AB833_01505 [Chromatiales bacterium (ex Bugula neritina AB1)]